MKYDHDGMTIWSGTPDAPAPGEVVPVGKPVSITIGVRPQNASHEVKVLYRVNNSPDKPKALEAAWIRSDASGKGQYYRAEFPSFQPGDRVEYTPVCRCVDKQVPHPAEWPQESKGFAASFKVVSASELSKFEPKSVPSPVEIQRPGTTPPQAPVAPDYSKDDPNEPWLCVHGVVRNEHGEPLDGVTVQALNRDLRSEQLLGEVRAREGYYEIRYRRSQLPKAEKESADLVMKVLGPEGDELYKTQIHYKAPCDLELDITLQGASYKGPSWKEGHESEAIRKAKPLEIVDFSVPSSDLKPYRVEGKVASRVRASLDGLRVVIVDKGVGGDVQLVQATTDDGGAYQATFSDSDLRRRGKAHPDLQARVFAGDSYLGASDVRYNASQHEALNVLLEDKAALALRSEHEVLISALARQYTGKLGDLKETDQQQDITYLANKTEWDARAVALAALSDQFSTRTTDPTGAAPAIPQAFFYALFRAGLPANEDTLYHTDARTLETVWKTALEQGVIQASADQIPNLIKRFQALSAQKLLTGPALVGASSFKETLTVSRLDDAQQARFAELYAANRTDMPAFWKAVRDAFGEQKTNRLQVDGKLGFLTINNASLMQKVHATTETNGLSDPFELAQRGFYKAEPWNQLLTDDVAVPKEIPGDTPESKRENYAAFLAAQVRLSYPTAAVAHMVNSGDLPLPGAAQGASGQVHAFLTQHQGKFEIGVQPVQQYIAQNNLQVPDDTVQQVKRLERAYQITPSDQALAGLMKRGIDAAYHVARYDKDTFVQSFAADLGGADQAAADLRQIGTGPQYGSQRRSQLLECAHCTRNRYAQAGKHLKSCAGQYR